jgi:hypothetical protein
VFSPAYDLLSTRLYQQLRHGEALPLNQRKEQLGRADFIAFGAHCGFSAEVDEAQRQSSWIKTQSPRPEALNRQG